MYQVKFPSAFKKSYKRMKNQGLDIFLNYWLTRILSRLALSINQVYTSLKKKVPQLQEALDGYFSDHHRFMLKLSLELHDFYQKQIEILEERINGYLSQYEKQVEILDSVPGIDVITASVIISEVGVDMSQFPTAGHLASWAGLRPGNNESAGKKRSTKIRHGNSYLKKYLS